MQQGFPRLGRVTSALDSVLDTASRTLRVLDVTDLMMRASFDAVAQLGFHHDFGMVPAILLPGTAPPNRVMHAFEEMMHEVPKRAANPFPAVPLPAHTLGGLLLSLADPADPGRPLPRARLLAELSNLFVAGADTTGHTMSWALYLVSLHPEVEARLVAELTELGLAGPAARPVEFQDLGRLRYLGAVVKETLRIMPVSAEGTAVTMDKDVDVCGYTIPAGTLIWCGQL
ncbi:hypothetical protein QBZ16_002655 [Prototheca wickerhamii]|uniref:Cytochrome P450 n=1 Tax=Prototheca wickerhamii TaxID=3111 RepID=A0AAD9ILS4_PROWI|nr:hypothetical protein QBZ16_002655 [Prototheca wickerhamii]